MACLIMFNRRGSFQIVVAGPSTFITTKMERRSPTVHLGILVCGAVWLNRFYFLMQEQEPIFLKRKLAQQGARPNTPLLMGTVLATKLL